MTYRMFDKRNHTAGGGTLSRVNIGRSFSRCSLVFCGFLRSFKSMAYWMFNESLSENGDRSERKWGRASFCARMRKILSISDEFERKIGPASTFAE